MKFNESVYWNRNSYGKAIRVKKSTLQIGFIIACVVTPCTNWLIPFVKMIVKNDLIMRY